MDSRAAIRARETGITLVELLVVIAIIAFASSAVLLNAQPGRPPARVDAERLAAKLLAVADLSVASGKRVRLGVDASGYSFEERNGGKWTAYGDPRFGETTLADGVIAVVEIDPQSFANEPQPAAKKGDRKSVLIDPLGAQAPFSIEFAHRAGAWKLSMDSDGEVRVASVASSR